MENYRALYKVPAKSVKSRGEKRETARREQKIKREDTFLERRNIQSLVEEDASACAPTPAAPPRGKTSNKQETRLEKLLRWKTEKNKIVAQQKAAERKRPPFKVGVAHHALDPLKELVSHPLPTTTVKCTTSKKAAAESRWEAAEIKKAKPASQAAASLVALSAPITTAAFSGRVTRSRAAAAATKTAVEVKAKKTQQRAVPLASSSKNSTVSTSATARNKALADAKHVKASTQKGTTGKGSKKEEVSFAPKDHKFKAPISLTLPTTPLALKRSAAGFKSENWPHIPGVSILSTSPVEPSPKIAKTEATAASNRRGRLARAAKEKTPRKSPEAVITSDERQSAKKMPRSLRKTGSGVFIVTDMPEPTRPQDNETVASPVIINDKPNNAVELSVSSSAGRSKRSMSSKKRQSLREKENVPEDKKEDPILETFSHEVDASLPTVVSSRRMSIHEPSPAINVSPDKLSKGMVPAQFSPFVTSARGKDKYSLQKRRSSLIPIVPEVSAEELARVQQVDHFRNLLERESSRLLTLSSLWEERLSETPPEEQDKVLGPVGQAKLLVKDKFQQFRRLVDKFESGDTEGRMTANDLTGFWEMMLLTVENVDKRFKELEDLKENNWKELVAEVPTKKPVAAAPAASKPSKPLTLAKSRLKNIIEAARKRKQEAKQNKSNVSSDVTTFDGGFFKVQSPKKVLSSPKVKSYSPAERSSKVMPSTPLQFHRRSLLQQVLTNSAVRAQSSPAASPLNRSLPLSPSPKVAVVQMRASELGKRMSMDSGNDSLSTSCSSPILKAEPTKSILKSAIRKSLRVNTPRNRVAFEVLNHSETSSPGSPSLLSPTGTPPNRTPVNQRSATPGNRKRSSLIPRLIPTPKTGERVSLLPVRESLVPSKPLSNGDLIDFCSPVRGSRS